MTDVRTVFGGLSVVASCVSAALWFWFASGITYDPNLLGGWGGSETKVAYLKQMKFSACAATATGISALLQAITLVLP
jgi:hypothetical protein